MASSTVTHDGQRHQVIVRELCRDALLVLGRHGIDDVAVHQLLDDCFGIGQQQILDGDDALQLSVGRGHKADVDRLLVLADAADAGKGVLDAHIFFKIHKFRGHDRAGGILRIVQILIDQVSRLARRGAHHTLDHVRGKLLHHVDRVVDVQLFHDPGKLRVRDRVDDPLLIRRIKIGKDLRRLLLGKEPEEHRHTVVFERGKEFSHIEFRHLVHSLAQGLHVAIVEHFCQLVGMFIDKIVIDDRLVDPFFVLHTGPPPCYTWLF